MRRRGGGVFIDHEPSPPAALASPMLMLREPGSAYSYYNRRYRSHGLRDGARGDQP